LSEKAQEKLTPQQIEPSGLSNKTGNYNGEFQKKPELFSAPCKANKEQLSPVKIGALESLS